MKGETYDVDPFEIRRFTRLGSVVDPSRDEYLEWMRQQGFDDARIARSPMLRMIPEEPQEWSVLIRNTPPESANIIFVLIGNHEVNFIISAEKFYGEIAVDWEAKKAFRALDGEPISPAGQRTFNVLRDAAAIFSGEK